MGDDGCELERALDFVLGDCLLWGLVVLVLLFATCVLLFIDETTAMET